MIDKPLADQSDGRWEDMRATKMHQRKRYENTTLLESYDDDRQAGPMRERKDKSTTQNLTVLRQEQGTLNVYIPKNERARQRPFDEAL